MVRVLSIMLLSTMTGVGLAHAQVRDGSTVTPALSGAPISTTVTAWERPVVGGVAPDGGNQCFARARIPAEIQRIPIERVVEPERTAQRVLPAVYANVTRTEVVSPARTEYVVVPGVYRNVVVTQPLSPERTEHVAVPAQYQTVVQRVVVRPSYVTWQPGCATLGSARPIAATIDDEILCRVQVPAEERTITRQRLIAPATIRTRLVPATSQTITRRELVTPARVEARAVPAASRVVSERKMVQPVRVETYTIPAVKRTDYQTRILRPERIEWREVLCDDARAPVKIRQVQTALSARGYRVAADGAYGPVTLAALDSFQRQNKLATGFLTIETMQALGVSPR